MVQQHAASHIGVIVGFFLLVVPIIGAQSAGPTGEEGAMYPVVPRRDGASSSATERNWGVVPIPVLGFSPDFGGILGLAAIVFYGPEVGIPPEDAQGLRTNTVALNGFGTTNGSFVLVSATTNYLAQDRYRVDTRLAATRNPSEYFGIGADTEAEDGESYTAEELEATVGLSRQMIPNLFFGPEVDLGRAVVTEREEGGVLPDGNPRRVGAGARLIWDSTGGVFFPEAGSIVDTAVLQYSELLGSGSDFGTATVDVRTYRRVWWNHVVALQGVYQTSWGDPPWNALPAIGGDGTFRGYLEGRFRDDNAVSAQLEYRLPLFPWGGVVVFGAVGQVGATPADLDWRRPKTAAGFGLRITLNRAQRLNLRIDVAFSDEGLGPYVNAREAF